MIRRLLLRALPWVMPMILRYAEQVKWAAFKNGRKLTIDERRTAAAVGVKFTGTISLWIADSVPAPESAVLRWLARVAGLPFEQMAGLTFDHCIVIRKDFFTPELFAHECRHARQAEIVGNLGEFLTEYLTQVLTYGYYEAPMEVEARAYGERAAA